MNCATKLPCHSTCTCCVHRLNVAATAIGQTLSLETQEATITDCQAHRRENEVRTLASSITLTATDCQEHRKENEVGTLASSITLIATDYQEHRRENEVGTLASSITLTATWMKRRSCRRATTCPRANCCRISRFQAPLHSLAKTLALK